MAPAYGPDGAALLAVAEKCCREAAQFLRQRETAFPARAKGPLDYVTEADLAVEDRVVRALTAAVPGSAVVGEERGTRPGEGVTWYVDPIDGTGNFLRGLPLACVSVGAAVGGELVAGCVYDIFRDECFTGADGVPFQVRPPLWLPGPGTVDAPVVLTDVPLPGRVNAESLEFLGVLLDRVEVRRVYSTALSLAWVASGRADAACNLLIRPWDVAAGAALVRAAGGTYLPVGGDTPQDAPGFVAVGPGKEELAGWLAGLLAPVVRATPRGRASA
ncbi:inositol monophosphatase [Streptomyces sp. TRM64462]|uniref:inositol monophosphatase family protein n=1 Tax=Streptomyces sp. TRM64462 TaxID=2741726 RepID=UPI001586904B|nr:inositol monophosphatase [Streptomyces sp. TRM64462]